MAQEQAVPLPQTAGGLVPWGALAAGFVVMAGSILPWASLHAPGRVVELHTAIFGRLTVAGTAGDGKFTVVLGMAIAILAGLYLNGNLIRDLAMWAISGIGAVVALWALYLIVDIHSVGADGTPFLSITVGFGLYILLCGGVGAVLSGLLMRREAQTQSL
jgi:hypothetical protein